MKIKTQYVCQECAHATPRWLGRCPNCEAWNCLVEEHPSERSAPSARAAQSFAPSSNWVSLELSDSTSEKNSSAQGPRHLHRLSTGIAELDRVLGGGLVPDSFTLLGGDPGIGKSTLLLQMAQGLRTSHPELKILYVTGEESTDQIRGRAHRLGVSGKEIIVLAETSLERALSTIQEHKPQITIFDSLQTFTSESLESAPGSVSQVREIAAKLMGLAKNERTAVFLVGHVTKEGNIAGPKTVEHMVDTVLYFEGDGGQSYRLLRTVKNRFGSSRELGVFEMEGDGLREVSNPSSLFLSDRKEPVTGTAVGSSLEGSRPLLVELQALVSPSPLSMPRRTSVGMDSTRVSLIAAILERHMRVSLAQQDLFFNVAGGLRLSEPACDLAAAAAIWSSALGREIPSDWIFIGEVGLTGEVRRVSQPDLRIEEARKLGFKTAVIPQSVADKLAEKSSGKRMSGIRLIPIRKVGELPEKLL